MRKIRIQEVILAAVVSVLVAGAALYTITSSKAAAGKLYLASSASSVQKDATQKVTIRLNPGTAVDGVEATMTYDASKLAYVSIDTSSSAFSVQLEQTISSGSVKLTRGSLSGAVSADSTVAVVTFKALAGSGSTSLGVSGNATAGGAYINPATAGLSLSFTTPAPKTSTPAPTPKPTPTTQPKTTTPSTSTTQPKTTTQPSSPSSTTAQPSTTSTSKQSITTETQPQFTTGAITVSATKAATVVVKYGTDPSNLNMEAKVPTSATSQTVKLGSLVGGTTYYYQVVAKNSGGTATTPVQSFKTKGFDIKVAVFDKNRRPLAGKKVTLHSDPLTAVTDKEGYAVFKDVAPGDHTVAYEQNGKTLSQPIRVEAAVVTAKSGEQTASVQNFAVVYDVQAMSMLPIVVTVSLLLVVAVAAYLFMRRSTSSRVPRHQVILPEMHSDDTSTVSPTVAPPLAAMPTNVGVVQQPQAPPPPVQGRVTVFDVPGQNQAHPGQVVSPSPDGTSEEVTEKRV